MSRAIPPSQIACKCASSRRRLAYAPKRFVQFSSISCSAIVRSSGQDGPYRLVGFLLNRCSDVAIIRLKAKTKRIEMHTTINTKPFGSLSLAKFCAASWGERANTTFAACAIQSRSAQPVAVRTMTDLVWFTVPVVAPLLKRCHRQQIVS